MRVGLGIVSVVAGGLISLLTLYIMYQLFPVVLYQIDTAIYQVALSIIQDPENPWIKMHDQYIPYAAGTLTWGILAAMFASLIYMVLGGASREPQVSAYY